MKVALLEVEGVPLGEAEGEEDTDGVGTRVRELVEAMEEEGEEVPVLEKVGETREVRVCVDPPELVEDREAEGQVVVVGSPEMEALPVMVAVADSRLVELTLPESDRLGLKTGVLDTLLVELGEPVLVGDRVRVTALERVEEGVREGLGDTVWEGEPVEEGLPSRVVETLALPAEDRGVADTVVVTPRMVAVRAMEGEAVPVMQAVGEAELVRDTVEDVVEVLVARRVRVKELRGVDVTVLDTEGEREGVREGEMDTDTVAEVEFPGDPEGKWVTPGLEEMEGEEDMELEVDATAVPLALPPCLLAVACPVPVTRPDTVTKARVGECVPEMMGDAVPPPVRVPWGDREAEMEAVAHMVAVSAGEGEVKEVGEMEAVVEAVAVTEAVPASPPTPPPWGCAWQRATPWAPPPLWHWRCWTR